MKNQRYHIPYIQPLSPAQLFTSKGTAQKYFPFSSPRSQFYYLARNGIWSAIDSLGLKAGDGILMPAYHHGVEVEVLKKRGLRLVYYRIDENMQIDINHVESLLSENIRALYIIHYIGFPQPIKTLRQIASRNNLFLIEDCALSLFSSCVDGPLGTFGDVSIFCLYKTLAVPHGGMLVLNKTDLKFPSIADSPNLASTIGNMTKSFLKHVELDWNGFGHSFSSSLRAFGRMFKKTGNLKHLPVDTNTFDDSIVELGVSRLIYYIINRVDAEKVVNKRRHNFHYLAQLFDGTIRMPFTKLPDGACPLFLPIYVKDKEDNYSRLLSDGIETIKFWSINNPDIPAGMFPEVDFFRKHVLEIPIHQELKEEHLDYIATKVKEYAKW